MATIDIGSSVIDRAGVLGGGQTIIDLANPASADFTCDTIKLWFDTNYADGSNVKVGTFHGTPPNLTPRNYITLTSVTKGSEQTFTAPTDFTAFEVSEGDYIGIYYDASPTQGIECSTSGGSGIYYKAGDQFDAGQQEYTLAAAYAMSAYGEGDESAGTQTITLAAGITSAEGFGTPTVVLLLQLLLLSTIASGESFPTPAVVLMFQEISPGTIASAEAFGTPTVGELGFIRPDSILSAESFGTPAVIRFVYHVILDGRFIQVTPAVNRVYVIGKDEYGNPVFGTSSDSDEISLVGERLDFQQELSVPSDDDAAAVAAAMVATRRLTSRAGFIVIPPNCGQELWDVIWIKDTPTAQAAQLYRVTSIRLEFIKKDTKQKLTHKFILGAR